MIYNKNIISNLLLYCMLLFVYSCGAENTTTVTILDFIDENGESIDQDIRFSINGKEALWISGNEISIQVPMKEEYGFIEIDVISDNYSLDHAKARFRVSNYEGLQLVISLHRTIPKSNIATLKINSIVDNNGNQISDEIRLKINGINYLWDSNFLIIAELESENEIDLAVIELTSSNYKLLSKDSYIITKDDIKEIELKVERVEQIQIIQYGTLVVNLAPSDANVAFRGSDTTFTVSTNRTIRLKEGVYQWSATRSNFANNSGQFSIRANATENLNIVLQPTLLKGDVAAQVSPSNAIITLENTSTNQTHALNTGQTLNLEVGTYKYKITLEGHLTYESEINVIENRLTIISHTMEPVSALNLIRDLKETNTIIRAINLFTQIPRTVPSMPLNLRVEYYDALVDFGVFLFRGGEQTMALEIFELILNQDENNYRARIQFATYLNQVTGVKDYERIRDVVRPLFGQLLNMVPVDERLLFDYRARFMHAESYYNQYTNTRNRNNAARAIAELEDVIRRFDALPQDAKIQLDQTQRRAIALRDILRNELGL